MANGYPDPIFLDATVLSDFASTDAIDVLVEALDSSVVVPAVRNEIEQGQQFGHDDLATAVEPFDDGLRISDVPSETGTGQFRERRDAGKAEGVIEHDGTLATDDLAARRLADDFDVPVTGSISLLLLGNERGCIDEETADEWLDTWRRGYYAPWRASKRS
jgi:predicted nucleic acid-binding protein